MTPERAKAFGAFYTNAVVAEFLVCWVVPAYPSLVNSS